MKKITKLTAEQTAAMPAQVKKWVGIGLSCEPIDVEKSKDAIRKCYEFAGLNPDVPYIKVTSPLVLAVAGPIADFIICNNILGGSDRRTAVDSAVDSAVRSAVRSAVDSAVRSAVDSAVGSAVDSAVRSAVRSAVYSAVDSAVYSAVYSAVDSAVDSAVGSVVGSAVYSAVDSAVGSVVRSAVDSAVGSAVRSAVYSAVDSAVYSAVRSAVDSAVDSAVGSAVYSAVYSAVDSAVRSAVRSELVTAINNYWNAYIGGRFWAPWHAFEEFLITGANADVDEDIKSRAVAYREANSNSGWWYPTKHFVMVCEAPKHIHLENKVLHHASELAIEWEDGWGFAAWRGTTVPGHWIVGSKKPTAKEVLSHANVEVRRSGCEIIGWDAVLTELNASMVDSHPNPEIGDLFEVNLPDAGKERFIRVRCGTGRTFVLPVPPSCRTALEANAWTYGIDDYESFSVEVRT